jgi:Protein-disulfide isomerase
MGGASRNEKKRRQEAADQRLAAAGIQRPVKASPNRTPVIVVAVVVAIAVVVGLTVLLLNRGSGAPVVPTYNVTVSGAVVTAGSGPVTIDVYEDYLCPNCLVFEKRDGDEITTALNEGKITMRVHGVAILDRASDPAGYSTRAANAALCSASAGIFPTYHKKLFDAQPNEGSAGLSDDQLVAFGTELGAKGDFAGCVRGATNAKLLAAETEAAAATPALQTNGAFGTPTVAVNGKKVDLNDTSWLKDAIAG